MRWAVAIQLSLLPFIRPSAIHAQQNNPSEQTNLACEITLETNKPAVLCVGQNQTIDIKPGDSNATIEVREKQEAAAKLAAQRRLQSAKIKLASATSSTDSNATKLYQQAGQCIPFARDYSGIQVSGAARTVSVNSSTPVVGSVMITYESAAGHAAVVTEVTDTAIKVIERNYFAGWVSTRWISRTASVIKGFRTS